MKPDEPDIIIGKREGWGNPQPFGISASDQRQHLYIIGKTGSGKTTLLRNLILQHITLGHGVGLIDPHGDLAEELLNHISPKRADHLVYFNPGDLEYPIGLNVLANVAPDDRHLVASGIVGAFKGIWRDSWGPRLEYILYNAVSALLDCRNATLLGVNRMLTDGKFRAKVIRQINDPFIKAFWAEEYENYDERFQREAIAPIQNKIGQFLLNPVVRNILGQVKTKVSIPFIMDNQRLFLAKLSEGLCGAENSYLLGTLLVSKFQQTAMSRQAQAAAARRDYMLYVDEFDHFISPSMAEILKGARKYRLGLTLAHQELHQLQSDPKVESAVATHPCTRIVFRVGDDDAKKLGEGFESFDARSLKTLEKFHAIARVERNDFDFNLALRKPDLSEYSDERKEAVIAASRAKYATPRAEVEAALLSNIQGADKKTAVPPPVIKRQSSAVAETPHVAEPPKASEVPKATVIPTTGIQKVTGSEKKFETKPTVIAQVTVAEPKDLGRGGARHKAIQSRLKTEAQKLGFHSEVEKQLAQGSNDAADLVLRRGQVEIAVEITITTGVDHEFENVKKCLAAGFNRVAVIATGRKQLEAIATAVQGGLGPEAAAKVGYYMPDEFLSELQKLAKATELPPPSEPMAKTGKILGFEITRNFPKQTPEEQRLNQQAIYEVTMKAMKS